MANEIVEMSDGVWAKIFGAAGELAASKKDFIEVLGLPVPVDQSTAPHVAACVRAAEQRVYAGLPSQADNTSMYDERDFSNDPAILQKRWGARAELDKAEANKAERMASMEVYRQREVVRHAQEASHNWGVIDAVCIHCTAKRTEWLDGLAPKFCTGSEYWRGRRKRYLSEAALREKVGALERERDLVISECTFRDEMARELKAKIGTLLFEAARRTDELREVQAELAALRAKHCVPAPDPKPLPAAKALSRAWGFR